MRSNPQRRNNDCRNQYSLIRRSGIFSAAGLFDTILHDNEDAMSDVDEKYMDWIALTAGSWSFVWPTVLEGVS